MKKEQITKFDLATAFTALNDIEIPEVHGLKPNRLNLKESVRRKDGLSRLMEDYVDLGNSEEVDQAIDDRFDERNSRKKVQVIVPPDTEVEVKNGEFDLVGKYVLQCPGCMLCLYKDPEDVNISEEDKSLANVGEACPQCGQTEGFKVGKVGEVDESDLEPEEGAEGENPEGEVEDNSGEESFEGGSEEGEGEANADDLADYYAEEGNEGGEENAEEEPEETNPEDEEELKEAFRQWKSSRFLQEEVDPEAKDYADSIIDVAEMRDELESKISSEKNPHTKKAYEAMLDVLNSDEFLPTEMANAETDELPDAEELPDEAIEDDEEVEDDLGNETSGEDNKKGDVKELAEMYLRENSETAPLGPDPTESEMRAMFNGKNSWLFKGGQLDNVTGELESQAIVEQFHERSFDVRINKYLTEVYSNIKKYETTNCKINSDKMIVEGIITFKSGNKQPTKFVFKPVAGKKGLLEGYNKDMSDKVAYRLEYSLICDKKILFTESLKYRYKINESYVSGDTDKED